MEPSAQRHASDPPCLFVFKLARLPANNLTGHHAGGRDGGAAGLSANRAKEHAWPGRSRSVRRRAELARPLRWPTWHAHGASAELACWPWTLILSLRSLGASASRR